MKGQVRVETQGGALEQELEGEPWRLLERLASLAAVVPKEATWEGTSQWVKKVAPDGQA